MYCYFYLSTWLKLSKFYHNQHHNCISDIHKKPNRSKKKIKQKLSTSWSLQQNMHHRLDALRERAATVATPCPWAAVVVESFTFLYISTVHPMGSMKRTASPKAASSAAKWGGLASNQCPNVKHLKLAAARLLASGYAASRVLLSGWPCLQAGCRAGLPWLPTVNTLGG